MLTCREEIALLPAYQARELDALTRMRLRLHLAFCAACRAYLRTYRATIALVARAADVSMPDEARERLRRVLSERTGEQRR
jgi:anti-sigma factor RsiW